ncbi:MAG: hypothetical protein IKE29_18505 [Paenibacillus sp.]|uniref:hypothetical protein n=1 Tax=Paenibacillus sp. TaxID=58172 RepID=UPI0025E8CED5|nr:hypothetical protein [Paenibacillus sp.]MBR2566588.1 hypothetical protein [Paenibacillus sp.]
MSIISDIKEVATIVQKADNIELYKKILDLQSEAMNILEQNNNLKAEVRELRDRFEIQEKLTFKNNKYWISNDEGPFCTKCWDVEKKLVRHQDLYNGYYTCPNCRMTAENESYKGKTIDDEENDLLNYW